MGVVNLSQPQSSASSGSVRWRRVGLFYGLTLGWAALLTAALYLAGQRDLSSPSAPLLAVLALGYLPAPMVAALIVERLDRRPAKLRDVLAGFRAGFGRLLLICAALTAALLASWLVLNWVAGNQLDVAGAGVVVTSPEDLLANALYLLGSMPAAEVASLKAALPNFGFLVVLGFLGAVVAGFTVNGLFALGEEYGWRGWLADELRPLGAFWANLITGVGWGVWYAPLVLLGYNYGGSRVGAAFMVAWCVLASFLLWRARQVTGSLLAPIVIHGAINALSPLLLLVVANPNPLISAPMGIIGMAGLGLVTVIFWLATAKQVAPIE